VESHLTVYFWQYDLDPAFPLTVLEYETRGTDDPMHWHEYLEIALCLEGAGRWQFGRRTYPAEAGDVFLIDNAEPHVASSDLPQTLRLLLVLFRPELIAAPGCRAFDSDYLSPFLYGGHPSANRIPHDTVAAAELAPIFDELRTTWDGGRAADRHLLDANLRRLLAVLIRHASAGPGAGQVDGDRHLQVRPVLSYVEAHFRESITLEQVSEHVHVSPSRVRHLFKDVTNVGFKEYVSSLRIGEARRLLLSTNTCVQAVADAVGYTNLHQFYKVFQRYSAMSPADYRRYYTRPDDAEDELLQRATPAPPAGLRAVS
jgi:AraC-like DNA-binding protein